MIAIFATADLGHSPGPGKAFSMAAGGFGLRPTPQPRTQATLGRTSSITWRAAGTKRSAKAAEPGAQGSGASGDHSTAPANHDANRSASLERRRVLFDLEEAQPNRATAGKPMQRPKRTRRTAGSSSPPLSM